MKELQDRRIEVFEFGGLRSLVDRRGAWFGKP